MWSRPPFQPFCFFIPPPHLHLYLLEHQKSPVKSIIDLVHLAVALTPSHSSPSFSFDIPTAPLYNCHLRLNFASFIIVFHLPLGLACHRSFTFNQIFPHPPPSRLLPSSLSGRRDLQKAPKLIIGSRPTIGIEEDHHLRGVYQQLEGRRERETAKSCEWNWKDHGGRRAGKETPMKILMSCACELNSK